MCSRPGGDRGPGLTFSHHVDALNQHESITVEELWKLKGNIDQNKLNEYDIFWFYAKGFDPKLYEQLKQICPKKKFVFA